MNYTQHMQTSEDLEILLVKEGYLESQDFVAVFEATSANILVKLEIQGNGYAIL